MKLTDSAVVQVSELIASEDNAIALRVGIVGGGCSGFNYTFSFVDKIDDGDFVFTDQDVTIVIDPMSHMYLEDSTLDFKVDLSGSLFTIDNPAAKTTCGCGTSFSV